MNIPGFSTVTNLWYRIDICSILAFVIPFAVYMLTLAPSVTFFDSGEFMTAIYSLGSAHSPGYPVFINYAKPFTWLPFGNIAFRINMATAFSASLACLGVFLCSRYLATGASLTSDERFNRYAVNLASLAAACSFAVTPRLWLQSNHDKPYPLLAFMTTVIFLLLLKWRDHYREGSDRPAYIYVCTFLAGLCMGTHQSVVMLLPSWIFLILVTDWKVLARVKEFIISVAFALLGFSIHLYLPVRATQNPLLNWGDSKTWPQFLWHFLRKGYPEEPHPRDFSLLLAQIKAFNIPREFTWVGALLLCFGLWFLWKRHRIFVMGYILGVLIFLGVIAGYFNTQMDMIFLTEEFFTPLYLLTAAIIGVALYAILEFAVRRCNQLEFFGIKVKATVALFFLTFPISLCALNYYENDQHNNYIAFDYATNSLRSLPQNAVMFTWGDSGAFPLWYVQGVEKMREDVDLPHTPHLVFEWYLDSMPRLFKDSNLRKFDIQNAGPEASTRLAITDVIDQRPTYIDFSTRYSISFSDFVPVQSGIIYRIRKLSEPGGLPDLSLWSAYNNRGIIEKISFLDLDTGKAIQIYANSYLEAGELLLSIGRFQEGLQMLAWAETITPDLKISSRQIKMRYGFPGT